MSYFAIFPDFRAFLESNLRKQYTTLTVGDVISVGTITKLEPEPAVCIIDADVSLDLIVVEDSNPTDQKWKIGSSHQVESQSRLWITGFTQNKILRITSQASVDIYASFPPILEASSACFDKLFLAEEDGTNSMLEISYAEWQSHKSPEFITVGSRVSSALTADLVEIADRDIHQNEVSRSSKEDFVPCGNCKRLVAPGSLELHVLRCEKAFKYCPECEKPIRREDMPNHSHCQECERPFDKTRTDEHNTLWHTTVRCLCGENILRSHLGAHRATTCTQKIILCRFCGLFNPVGDLRNLDARDRVMGFASEHEAACGNRTERCEICERRERLKDMPFHHQAYHGGHLGV